MLSQADREAFDIFIVGGGVNGCGVARDAAGRGLRVALAEMNDLGSGTSSASTKLIHGGLRYLEYFEFRLVKESLAEREILLQAMPHIIWPLRFILPYHSQMRFSSDTPASKLLNFIVPWQKNRRPAWLIRLALLLYDSLGRRNILAGTSSLDLSKVLEGEPLRDEYQKAFEYSDCWVQDSRLVVLNARDAAARGARIMPRTRVVAVERQASEWVVVTEDQEGRCTSFRTNVLINATGPWASDFLSDVIGSQRMDNLRLVRGSHIVTKRLYLHEKCYFFQGYDGRIIFVIPYEDDFTLIGTTDEDQASIKDTPTCSQKETTYLLEFVSKYFKEPISCDDVVWAYSGVRPLYDNCKDSASAASRDYVIRLETSAPPLLNIFGGKLTTYRKLAETALSKISPFLPNHGPSWTAGQVLPGGDFPINGAWNLVEELCEQYPYLNSKWASRLVKHYGTDAYEILQGSRSTADLGENFATTVTERELEWGVRNEWVQTAEDFLWRRTRLGLRFPKDEVDRLEVCINRIRHADRVAAPVLSNNE
ncbi:MAG: glycerol-3-phosphate dehydrogenase [Aestuariivita sp.]|nr:glycerol-3-phosphate dehydrogenase [Aestuariivita sp.]MCY4345469.1 glycerol-3-phosphate dehydrogenase [Aestuariivita sp.]